MAAKKSEPSRSLLMATARALVSPGGRWLTLSTIVLAGLAVGWTTIWRQVRQRVLSGEAYRVDRDDIVLSPAPAWITTDVSGEALSRGGLEFPLDLLEPQLLTRVAAAVEAHPWVSRVAEVRRRHPARIEVSVEYRRPAAMIEVEGGLYPVDGLGFLLPSADFTPESAARWPRVGGFATSPLGPPGSPWGDPRVVAAAKLGSVLSEHWASWKLARIHPLGSAMPDGANLEFEIATAGGGVIVWGHPPGDEVSGEPLAETKFARLKDLASRPHGLDGDAPAVIDLRRAHDVGSRTAAAGGRDAQ